MTLAAPPCLPAPTLLAALHPATGAPGCREVAEEVAVALSYDGATQAVMMATPTALEDFALGFSLTEGIIEHPDELLATAVVPRPQGLELRLSLAAPRQAALLQRRRLLRGPLGCGLCGVESLEAAMRPPPAVTSDFRLPAAEVPRAIRALDQAQALNRLTHSMHAAGFWLPGHGLLALREDVGRHNALDKLGGALARQGLPRGQGAVLLTSRVSVELVQKTAMLGVAVLVAISAPTGLAIRTAAACGIALVGIARGSAFEVFSRDDRVIFA